TAVLVAGFQWYRNQKWAYYPEVVMTHQSNLSYLVGGLRTTYAPDHRKRQSFHVLTKYASVGVMVVGLQYENENLLVGGSYDVPISRSFKETTTVEIGLTLREKIAPEFRRKIRRKRTIKRSSKSKRPNRNRLSKRQLANETNSSDREALSENGPVEEPSVPPIMEEEVHKEDTIKTQSNVGELERFPPFHQGNTIKLTFKSNESTIDAPSETTLRFLAHYLQRNPSVRIQIVGHTDDVGSNSANQKLSLKRATSIKAFLLGATIASDRIKVTGRGEIDPLVPNTSSKNRSINRRVEIILN
ncbi:MAG: OmpA family protein, partial [Bacteroidota bacterium]